MVGRDRRAARTCTCGSLEPSRGGAGNRIAIVSRLAASSVAGRTCALVTTCVPSPIANAVPRNWNGGERVRSNVPMATTERLTRAIVSSTPAATAANGNASAPATSAAVATRAATGHRGRQSPAARIGSARSRAARDSYQGIASANPSRTPCVGA